MKDKSKDDKNRRLGESTDNMKQYIRRSHRERKEAAERANKEILEEERRIREDMWQKGKEGEAAARKAMEERTIHMRKEAAATRI